MKQEKRREQQQQQLDTSQVPLSWTGIYLRSWIIFSLSLSLIRRRKFDCRGHQQQQQQREEGANFAN